MKKKYIFLVLLTFILASCNNNLKSSKNLKIDDDLLNSYKDNSKHSINSIIQNNDTIDIGSSGNLVYRPLGNNLSKEGLEEKFNIGLKEIELHRDNKKFRITTYAFKKSKIAIKHIDKEALHKNTEGLAEYKHQKPNLNEISFATILNPEITILDNIKIGMNKKDFFLFLFNKYDENLKKIKIVYNGDIAGELIEQQYIFEGDILKKIIFNKPR